MPWYIKTKDIKTEDKIKKQRYDMEDLVDQIFEQKRNEKTIKY